MPTYSWPVHPGLNGYVASIDGYDYVLDPDALHHGKPSTALTVIIAFDEPLDCGWLGEPDSRRFWLLAGGLHTRPALIRTHGHQHGLQLGVTPRGSRALLGVPAGTLSHEIVPHDALPRGLPDGLHDRLARGCWRERFTTLEHWLLGRVHDDDSTWAPEVARAWELIRRRHGQLRMAELAGEVGWSRRHLTSRFSAETGVTPKEAGRLARFERAGALLHAGSPLADVAATAGYADQSHLNREWRALAGQTPRQMLTEFPNVQDPVP